MKDCLSPRSANLPSKQPIATKPKEKNHAAPPPFRVVQPPGPDGQLENIYTMGKELGKGGFAICYEGTLPGQKPGSKATKYALKIVKANMGVKKMEEKFKTELQIHSKMRHPNIVEFHRAFTFEENTYIVLELCPNGSMKDMVSKRKGLSLPEVRRYGVQLCGAIKYLHSRNVIHRDLKMGNIFLDKDMNTKLGDFGLAAILLTKADVGVASRRTTLCGTPNYIAPEILERGRKGHDCKVDIWALGVIIFALLTGYPPFADKLQEEIYRKVKTLDYNWPESKRIDYPGEVKALVTSLLQVLPEDRPEPDQIVEHSFFTMHGGSAIPSIIEPKHFSSKPEWLKDGFPRGDLMAEDAPRVSIEALAQQCGVGCFAEVSNPVVGEDVGKSIYQALVLEEAIGRAPTVPLPENFVYASSNVPTLVKQSKPIRAMPRRPASMRVLNGRGKPSIITVPAIQEEPKRAMTVRNISSRKDPSLPLVEASESKPTIIPVSSTSFEPKKTINLRSTSSRDDPSLPAARASESKPTVPTTLPEPKKTTKLRSTSNKSEPAVSSEATTVAKPTGPSAAIIGPEDAGELVDGTSYKDIVATLSKLSATITKCLQDVAKADFSSTIMPKPSDSLQNRPHVVKWVDYSNKFGMGYILANGNVGCIFNGTDQRASCCVMVPDVETHLAKKYSGTYKHHLQIVPRDNRPITFLESRGETGLERVFIPAKDYAVNISKHGLPEKLSTVANTHDNEKRRILSLWDKFAKYMTQTLGDATETLDDLPNEPMSSTSDSKLYIRFYQRLGNVGIWGFGNCTFQFNFPDHTKLVISPDGWVDFYHLSVSAAQLLKKGRILPKSSLENRQVLSYHLSVLLAGKYKDHDYNSVLVANEFSRKVRFVKEVVGAWARNGGMGCMGRRARELKWEGMREGEGKQKLVWVTVGKGGGDERYDCTGGKGQ